MADISYDADHDTQRTAAHRGGVGAGVLAEPPLQMRAAQMRAQHGQSRAVLDAISDPGGGAHSGERSRQVRDEAADRGVTAGSANSEPLGVYSAYVPLAALPDVVPSGWVADHAFIEFDDGWSAGFTSVEGDSKGDARIHIPEPRRNDSRKTLHLAERKADDESQSKSPAEIKRAIRAYAQRSPGKYNLVTNNCGDWVKRAFDNCYLEPKTPWRIY